MVKLFALGDVTVSVEEAGPIVGKEEDPDAVACTDDQLRGFLDGLIIERRGPREPGAPVAKAAPDLTNNEIFKKLRIAFNLRADDVVSLLAAGGQKMSKSELTALFRKPTHKNYRACGNQVLRKFMVGLEQSLHRKSPGPG